MSNSKTLYLKINPRRLKGFDCDRVAHFLNQEDPASGAPVTDANSECTAGAIHCPIYKSLQSRNES